ncbi:MAG: peptidylprolyl isomerase [Thermoleophilia bacterium]
MKAVRGNVVTLHYTLTDDDGTLLDTSEQREPLAYLHGYGAIIPGLESALEGVEAGYKGTIVVPAADAYGERDPEAVFEVPRESFPGDLELIPGMRVAARTPQGEIAFTVIELTDGGAVLDGNHPLAGKTLHFAIEVADIRPATERELAEGCADED